MSRHWQTWVSRLAGRPDRNNTSWSKSKSLQPLMRIQAIFRNLHWYSLRSSKVHISLALNSWTKYWISAWQYQLVLTCIEEIPCKVRHTYIWISDFLKHSMIGISQQSRHIWPIVSSTHFPSFISFHQRIEELWIYPSPSNSLVLHTYIVHVYIRPEPPYLTTFPQSEWVANLGPYDPEHNLPICIYFLFYILTIGHGGIKCFLQLDLKTSPTAT